MLRKMPLTTQDQVEKEAVTIEKCSNHDMVADIFTKAPDENKFLKFREMLSLQNRTRSSGSVKQVINGWAEFSF